MSGIFSDSDARSINHSIRSDGFWTFFKRQIQIQSDIFNRKLILCELGPGTGSNAFLAAKEIPLLFKKYFAIEGSKELLHILEKEKLPNVVTINGDFDSNRILPNADVYFSKFVFHHIKNKKTILQEMFEKLSSGGSVLIIDKFPRLLFISIVERFLDFFKIKKKIGRHYYLRYSKFRQIGLDLGFKIELEIIKKPFRLKNFFVYKVFLVLRKP
jgi:ubiquinone/menaquinone biosynthesis C-methylase UbiE